MEYQDTKVVDLMSTALITMKPDETVGGVDMEMKLSAIRHIPIVDDRNQLVGIVSNRDILRELGKRGASHVAVRDIMTRRVHTISEDALAREAAELILEHKIGALPVLGDDQQLVGVVTETDFVRFASKVLGGISWAE